MSPFITVTGADEQTNIGVLAKLDAEIGLLYTATPEGRNRYPRFHWLVGAAAAIPRVAIHICGSNARGALKQGRLVDLVSNAQRIQVNGRLRVDEVEDICALYYTHTIITQHNHENRRLLAVSSSNHSVLIDGSGGRGISPTRWPLIGTRKTVGFAGGLSADNLQSEIPKIEKVAHNGWWVDMEGKLRTNDWFSIEKATAAVNAFHHSRMIIQP